MEEQYYLCSEIKATYRRLYPHLTWWMKPERRGRQQTLKGLHLLCHIPIVGVTRLLCGPLTQWSEYSHGLQWLLSRVPFAPCAFSLHVTLTPSPMTLSGLESRTPFRPRENSYHQAIKPHSTHLLTFTLSLPGPF